MATFDRHDPPTPESHWCAAPAWTQVAALDLTATAQRWSRVVVASAHPDDETLGVGALVFDLAARGMSVTVIVATAGERSHEVADGAARSRLAQRRRREVERAVAALAPTARVVHCDYADTELEGRVDVLAQELGGHLGADSLLLAPWVHDGHADHDALGRAAQRAAAWTGAALAHYPVWMWHWSTPDEVAWGQVVAAEPSLSAIHRKRSALECFTSQTMAWSGDPGRQDPTPLLDDQTLARARRLVETVFDPAGTLPTVPASALPQRNQDRSAVFDDMYRDGPDAWMVRGSFYERRRRSLVLSMLGRPEYRRGLEVGCADGHLTSALVERVAELQALDVSSVAVDHARAAAPHAHISVGAAPAAIPPGPFDLVLISEVGYFLSPLEWLVTLQRARSVLAPDGELILCHWQHPTTGVPLDGPTVHQQARDAWGPAAAHYGDADVCIDLWTGASSVAQREARSGAGSTQDHPETSPRE
ncbi:MAG: PIG-L family deacetylase [Ornithinimicrobium sp.]